MITEKEIWKPIKDYELFYQISNLGRVKSLHNKEKILKQSITGEYSRVSLQKHGKSVTKSVHILVIQTFKGNIPNYYVNHVDGNKKNNTLNNLEWCTLKENTKHAIEHKLFIPKTYRVSQYSLDKKVLIRIFDSVKDAMIVTGINDASICKNCKNKSGRAGSYFWKYTDFEYKPIPEPEGKSLDNYPNYIITTQGDVYSKSHKKFMSKRINGGYEYISLGNGKKKSEKKDFSIHYLVAKLYISNPHNYPMINHKNSIKTDNNIKTKTSNYTKIWKSKFPGALSLKQKSEVTGVPLKFIKESYNRGMAAWRTGHRPGATEQQWGYARVHSFLLCGKTYHTADSDLVKKARKTSKKATKWWTSIGC